ncbi:CPBP family intramembrane glutamic endopeptidase [Glaciecola sp. 2405UD65-10]|uniref:CPBP family intramembrane glutamic endopeptidase n=1 Tax=Glaciecola sp. 2405UD65-10 TaxID=3397244 RepID=UPI003B5C6BFC
MHLIQQTSELESKPVLVANRERWTELFLLFFLLPCGFYFVREYMHFVLLPLMVFGSAACMWVLLKDHKFKRFRLWNKKGFKKLIKPVVFQFFALMVFTTGVFYWLDPEQLFYLPKFELETWLLLLIVYPLFSALPQELIFRTFLFHRYKHIIPRKKHRVLLSSVAFGFAHLFYANWVAVILSMAAGYVFSKTYAQSRSTILVALEHSFWGAWVFTLGLGSYFTSSMI